MNRFLVPIDGSECSNLAIAKAAELAKLYHATLHVITVYNVDTAKSVFDDRKTIDMQAKLTEDAERIVADARKRCEELGVPCEAKALEGVPADRIIEYADELDVDLIIMGSRGLTGLRRIVGSVTTKVLAQSDRNVLVIQ